MPPDPLADLGTDVHKESVELFTINRWTVVHGLKIKFNVMGAWHHPYHSAH